MKILFLLQLWIKDTTGQTSSFSFSAKKSKRFTYQNIPQLFLE